MNKDFFLLKSDYDSSDIPDFYDGKTIETLCSIAYNIYKGEYKESEFDSFVHENLGNGDFAKLSKTFVSNSILFLIHSKRILK